MEDGGWRRISLREIAQGFQVVDLVKDPAR
jgi:hypothetical protein